MAHKRAVVRTTTTEAFDIQALAWFLTGPEIIESFRITARSHHEFRRIDDDIVQAGHSFRREYVWIRKRSAFGLKESEVVLRSG